MSSQVRVKYHVIQTNQYVEDSGMVRSYGICCEELPVIDNDKGALCQVIPDISIHQEFVEELIYKLVLFNADPIHLRDLIEDYIG